MHFIICFWGLLRSLQYTYQSIQQNCLDPLIRDGHTYSIFVHTYTFSGNYSNKRSHEDEIHLNFTEWQRLNPQYIHVQNQDDFDKKFDYGSYETMGDPWHNNFTSFRNHLRALNSLHHLSQALRRESHKRHIDGVILLRPDVMYMNELPYQLMLHYNKTLFLPDFHRSCDGKEVNDRVAMGDVKSAIIYASRIKEALEYSKKHKLHSESFTKYHLTKNHVNIVEMPFRFRRVRADGKVSSIDSTLVSPEEQFRMSSLDVLKPCFEQVLNGQKIIADPNKLFCSPHARVWHKDWLKLKQFYSTVEDRTQTIFFTDQINRPGNNSYRNFTGLTVHIHDLM